MSDDIFNFEIVPVNSNLQILYAELLSTGLWDNLFYRGILLEKYESIIRCISPCLKCYHSWFKITYSDFRKNYMGQLVKDNYITNEIIKEKNIAIIKEMGGSFFYNTKNGASANYIQIKCNVCNTLHLLVLGISEMAPGSYDGQLHGVWRIGE